MPGAAGGIDPAKLVAVRASRRLGRDKLRAVEGVDGLSTNPDEGWIFQAARNVTDAEQGFLRGKRYLLMDRDSKFSEAFRITLEAGGIEPVRLPPRSPNLTPHIERFMRSLKEECLECLIIFGERSLQAATANF